MQNRLLLTSFLALGLLAQPIQALDIVVTGLFKDGAILRIDGSQHTLRAGERSPEGVLLVAADSKQAVLEIDGERRSVGMSRRISTQFTEPGKAETRIQSGRGGHFYTPGRINGKAVDFLVDTGATTVAMNLPTAKRLGIDYRNGRQVSMNTASGVSTGYSTLLRSVRVGSVEVKNVEGIVSMGDFPTRVLLGKQFS